MKETCCPKALLRAALCGAALLLWNAARAADTGAGALLDFSLEQLSQVEIKTDITSIRAKPVEEQPGIVSVITAAQIHQAGSRDLTDVLMLVPGFSLDTDVESMIGLMFRGLQGQEGKALLIVNGMEINEPLYGSLPILNHIPAELIKQVEVIRGPGGAQYGGSAGLSVIRVTTNDANQNGGYAVATPSLAGGRVSENYVFGAGFTKSDWRWSSNFSYTSTTLSNRDYVSLDGNRVNLTHRADMHPLLLDVGLGWRDFDVKLLYDRYRYDDIIDYGEIVAQPNQTRFDSLLLSAKYDLKPREGLRITPALFYRSQVPWYVSGLDGQYDVKTDRLAGSLTAVQDITASSSAMVGVQWQRDSAKAIESSFYAEDPATYYYGNQSVAYKDTAVFGQYDVDTKWANFSFGGRYEHHDAVGGHFVPRLAVTKAWEAWHVKLLASRASRIPAINVLQEAQGGAIKSEQTANYEIELGRKLSDQASITGNVFYMAVDRPIVFTTTADGSSTEGYFNGKQISTAGFETELRFAAGPTENYLGYSFYRAVNNDEPYVRGDRNRFLGSPTHKLAGRSVWHATPSLDLSLSGYWIGSRRAFTYPSGEITSLDPELVLNTYVEYRWHKVYAGIGIANLLDVDRFAPQPYSGGEAPVPLMGREWFLKLGVKF